MTARGGPRLAGVLDAASPDDALARLERGWQALGAAEEAEEARDRLRDLELGLLIFVVGEGKFGKSSLINALVGAQVAPVSHVPCTWKVDLYEASRADPHALLHWIDQVPERVTIEQARNVCIQEKTEAEQRQGQRYRSRLRQVSWRLPALHLPEDVALVDTPGFAQIRGDLDLTRVSLRGARGIEVLAKEPFDYWYHRADVVLWVFKATRLTDRDTRDALEKLAPQGKRVLGVITHMDRVPEDQRPAVVEKAREEFGRFVTDFVPVVTKADHPGRGGSIARLRERLERDYFGDVRAQKAAALHAFLSHSGARLHGLATSISVALDRNRSVLRKTVARVRELGGRAVRDIESRLFAWQLACERRATTSNEYGWEAIPAQGDDAGMQREVRRILDVEAAASELRATAFGLCERLRADLVETCARCEFIGVRMSRDGSETFVQAPDLTAAAAGGDRQTEVTGRLGDVLTGSEGLGAGLLLGGIGLWALGPIGIVAGAIGFLFAEEIQRQKLRKFTKERIATWFRDQRATVLACLEGQIATWENACESALYAEFARFSGLPLEGVTARLREYRAQVLWPLEGRRFDPRRLLLRLLVPVGVAAAAVAMVSQSAWLRGGERAAPKPSVAASGLGPAMTGLEPRPDGPTQLRVPQPDPHHEAPIRNLEAETRRGKSGAALEHAASDGARRSPTEPSPATLSGTAPATTEPGTVDSSTGGLGAPTLATPTHPTDPIISTPRGGPSQPTGPTPVSPTGPTTAVTSSALSQRSDASGPAGPTTRRPTAEAPNPRAGTPTRPSGKRARQAPPRIWLDDDQRTSMEFVLVRPGNAVLGDADGEADEPPRRVVMDRPYWIQATEVTQGQWMALMGTNPSQHVGQACPVEQVSWADAQSFMRRLTERVDGLAAGLPTADEWEYACRAGSKARWGPGDDDATLSSYAWFERNSNRETHTVGKMKANSWGLSDMHGNVWEWCSDPAAGKPAETAPRAIKGGSYLNFAWKLRSAERDWLPPDSRRPEVGFRVVLR